MRAKPARDSIFLALGKVKAAMADKQLLHLVFGGRVKDPQGLEFENLEDIDVVGVFPNYREAERAWRGASQSHVDDAMCRYVIVHLHRLIDPEAEIAEKKGAA